MSLNNLCLFVACAIFFSWSCRKDLQEHLAANAIVSGLEEGSWKVYLDSLGGDFSEGSFRHGVKIDTWKYVNNDTSYTVTYKRNPLRLDEVTLGVPVSWDEIESDNFSFLAVDTFGQDATVIVNTVTAPNEGVSIDEFVRVALSGITQNSDYDILNCKVQKLYMSNMDSIVVGKIQYSDTKGLDPKSYRFLYKKFSNKEFLDASVAGSPSDSVRLAWIFNDFISNVVVEDVKVFPYGVNVTNIVQINCTED